MTRFQLLIRVCIFIFITSFFFTPSVFSNVTWSNSETLILTDRHEKLVEEAKALYQNEQYWEAKVKLDEYIDKVFFVKDCDTIQLYSDILQGLKNTEGAVEYTKYFGVCNESSGQKGVSDFLWSINNSDVFEDKNLFLWKMVWSVLNENKLLETSKYKDSDNFLFTTMLYVANNPSKGGLVWDDFQKRILDSDHITKPTLIYFYIDHLLASGKDISDYWNMIEEILSYEDRFIASGYYKSSHVYAYTRLWDIETDAEKKLLYRSLASGNSDSFNNDKQFSDNKLAELERSIFEILINNPDGVQKTLSLSEIDLWENMKKIVDIFTKEAIDIKGLEELKNITEAGSIFQGALEEDSLELLQSYIYMINIDWESQCKEVQNILKDTGNFACNTSASTNDSSEDNNTSFLDDSNWNADGNTTSNWLPGNNYLYILIVFIILIGGFVIMRR